MFQNSTNDIPMTLSIQQPNMFTPRIIVFFVLISSFLIPTSLFAYVPERRDTMGEKEFGWFVTPTPVIIPGIGSAVPILAMLSNTYETTDIMAMQTLPGGDFEMRMLFADQFPLFTDDILLQTGYFEGTFPVKAFRRGIDSDVEDYTTPLVKQAGNLGNIRFLAWEKRIRFFYSQFDFTSSTEKIFDADGNEFSNVDTSSNKIRETQMGMIFDITDNRVDPWEGIRFGIRRSTPDNQDKDLSDYHVTDYNLTFYVPMFDRDTLVFNLFRSEAAVTREGLTNETAVRNMLSLGCDSDSNYTVCKKTEDQRVEEFIAANRYGTASPLGGANRLQAYDINRFAAGNSSYQAIEYRLNFSSVETPFNWYVIGGLKTNLQLAFFAERGTVSDNRSELNSNFKTSYGIGFRTLISGLVYRFDLATGDEGIKPTLFFFYPMDLQPVGG